MLTDRVVKAAVPNEKATKLADAEGLYLFITTKGTKSWRYDYRFGGKRRTLTIGTYPQVTLREARTARDDARALLVKGTDPAARKRDHKREVALAASTSFRSVADTYIDSLREKGYADATITKNEWLRDILAGKIGHMPIADVRPLDIMKVLRIYEAARKRETATRLRTFAGSVFRMAILEGHIEVDPTYALRGALAPVLVENHPAIIVEKDFAALLRKIDAYRGIGRFPSIRAALQMLALTFTRPGELRFAEWDEFDVEDGVWRIPASRMKMRRPHDVPLTVAALRILREMARYTNRQGYVFPSPFKPKRPLSENSLNKALDRMGYKRRQTAHGLRASASSLMNDRKMARPEVIEMQLAHIEQNKVRRAYNRALYWDERVAMMKDWSRYLDKLRQSN